MQIETQKGEGMKVGTIIENYCGCKIMENFGSFVDKCIIEPGKRQKWTYTANHNNSAMVILHQKTSYSKDQTLKLQLMIDCAHLVLR